jgi:hypothetical protein
MKLINMSLDKARDCLVEMTPYLGALVSDPEVLAFFDGGKKDNPIASLIAFVGKMMRDHYDALVCILSVLTGESQDAIRQKPAGEVFVLAKGVYDEDLKRFFTS